MKIKLSPETISSIAQDLDCGFSCIVNLDTGDYETIMDESFNMYGYGDDPMLEEIEAKVESWENSTKIKPPYSDLSFSFMEQFVDEVIPEGSAMQEKLYRALSKGKPFINFRNIIDCSDYLDDWYAFKERCQILAPIKPEHKKC